MQQALDAYNKNDGKSVFEEEIAKKMFCKKPNENSADKKPVVVELKKAQASSSKDPTIILEKKTTENKVDIDKEEEEQNKEVIEFEHKTCNKDQRAGEILKPRKQINLEEFPPWLPKLKEGVEIVAPLTTPPSKTKQVRQLSYLLNVYKK